MGNECSFKANCKFYDETGVVCNQECGFYGSRLAGCARSMEEDGEKYYCYRKSKVNKNGK